MQHAAIVNLVFDEKCRTPGRAIRAGHWPRWTARCRSQSGCGQNCWTPTSPEFWCSRRSRTSAGRSRKQNHSGSGADPCDLVGLIVHAYLHDRRRRSADHRPPGGRSAIGAGVAVLRTNKPSAANARRPHRPRPGRSQHCQRPRPVEPL